MAFFRGDIMKRYVVELEDGVWIADTDGDPGRTLKFGNAQLFESESEAAVAIGDARDYRPFPRAHIVPCSVDPYETE
jgi:hypothetical protein